MSAEITRKIFERAERRCKRGRHQQANRTGPLQTSREQRDSDSQKACSVAPGALGAPQPLRPPGAVPPRPSSRRVVWSLLAGTLYFMFRILLRPVIGLGLIAVVIRVVFSQLPGPTSWLPRVAVWLGKSPAAPFEPTANRTANSIFQHGVDIVRGTAYVSSLVHDRDLTAAGARIVNESFVSSALSTTNDWDEYWAGIKKVEARIETADASFRHGIEDAVTDALANAHALQAEMVRLPAATRAREAGTPFGRASAWLRRLLWQDDELPPTHALVLRRLDAFAAVVEALREPMSAAEHTIGRDIDQRGLTENLCGISRMFCDATELGEWYFASSSPHVDTPDTAELGRATLELRKYAAVARGVCRETQQSHGALGDRQVTMRGWVRNMDGVAVAIKGMRSKLLRGEPDDEVAIQIEKDVQRLVSRFTRDLPSVLG